MSSLSNKLEKNKYSRIVVKAGTSLLTNGLQGLDLNFMNRFVDQVSNLHENGVEVVLISSGAVGAGRIKLSGSIDIKHLSFRQMLASIGQPHLMYAYEELFSKKNIIVAQALLSKNDFSNRLGYLNIRNTLFGLINNKVIPIINENDVVSVDELQGQNFGDNDNLSAMVANLIDADLLIILSDIKGMFTKDPNLYNDAELIREVNSIDEKIYSMGGASSNDFARGGMATKIEAAKLATSTGISTIIADGLEDEVLIKLLNHQPIGTIFKASNNKLESRKRWMLSGLLSNTSIVIDDGAVNAIIKNPGSLLPAGVVEINGEFDRGSIISIVSNKSKRIGVGITNYSSQDLEKIKGIRSDKIFDILEYRYGDEVVHRNNMVLL
ncbi:MAG: glutamate 5-kinase [Chloroflexi bacterium]|nr:glutamate 5-kinase [Chloroflexota bacterium]|tara:strand:+ start:48611 stop:49753 length:1143 start_codon:yes stop_codon:yes gene_type:complete